MIPMLVAATCDSMGDPVIFPVLQISLVAWVSATYAPVIAAVLVPPSAWSTSQSIWIVRSPNRSKSIIALSERPIRRWISCDLPLILPLVLSLVDRVLVALGSMSYSAVTHPFPLPFKNAGTCSSTEAAHKTFVLPVSINAEPSADNWNDGVICIGRTSSHNLPSDLVIVIVFTCLFLYVTSISYSVLGNDWLVYSCYLSSIRIYRFELSDIIWLRCSNTIKYF